MSDAREALVAHLGRAGMGSGLHDGLKRYVLGAWADTILVEFDVTPRGAVATDADWREAQALVGQDGNVPESAPTTLPSVEDVARRVDEALRPYQVDPSQGPSDAAQDVTRAVLALLPGRTEAEVKAEALREAASAAVTDDEGIPWDDDYDRATVGAWLEGRADRIEKEADDGR